MPQAKGIPIFPNLDTQEKMDRVGELVKVKDAAWDRIARFILNNEEAIITAIQLALQKGLIYSDEDEEPLHEELRDIIRQHSIEAHRMTHFMSTGKEDTQFVDRDKDAIHDILLEDE